LLWLATDESGDINNCSCKFCSPEELELEKVKEVKTEAPARPLSAVKTTSKQGPSTTPLPRKTSTAAEATVLPRPRCLEQKQDQRYNEFHYRPGELVWFCRGQAWGIGALVSRDYKNNNARQYTVQPLTHSWTPTPTVTLPQDQLRNWLAWSPPPLTHAALNPSPENNNRVLTFPDISWPDVIAGRYGRGDVTVDASILSAKMVETTYTLFDRIDAKTSSSFGSQVSEIHYNGLFLGGEKIWLGDPLRLRSKPSNTTPGTTTANEILILHSITERSSPTDSTRSTIILVGDTYAFRAVPPSHPAPSPTHLPQRVLTDLSVRNSITASNPTSSKRHHTWTLLTSSISLTLSDVKGRWYETSLFTPILDPASFAAGKAKGEVLDAGLFMNGQGDCNKPHGGPATGFKAAEVKCRRREDAFGRSVPVGFRISGGLDEVGSSIAGAGGAQGVRGGSANLGGQLGQRMQSSTPIPQQTIPQRLNTPSQTQGQQQIQQQYKAPLSQAQQVKLAFDQAQTAQQVKQALAQANQAQQAQHFAHQQQQQQSDLQTSQMPEDGYAGSGGGGGQQIPEGAFDQYLQFDDMDTA